MTTDRVQELALNLREVRLRIETACLAAGRDGGDVALIGVTKTWPAADAIALRDLGVGDLAENRDQEARAKARAVTGVRWHFIGSLQTNKARSVSSYADVVHSVDRAPLVTALEAATRRAGRVLGVLLQVSLDGDPSRGGAAAADLPYLADQVTGAEGLVLLGVAAVAPRAAEPTAAFAALRELSEALVAQHPAARQISAGMSGDLEAAVAAGATHVRVGTALLGPRSRPLR